MCELTVKEVVNAVKGRLLCGEENTVITFATTNSKEVVANTLFIPVIGERVDGHQYILAAFEAGAVATFTSRHNNTDGIDVSKVYIAVENTIEALQMLGSYYRDKFDIPVIGITGSVGKTTTKEMIAAALETKYKVLKTAGNMNSQIGLPLMMLRISKEHEAAVIEMGMSEPGEMIKLAKVAKPSTAVLTNIGVSHIGQLGTQENIRKEKLDIISRFGNQGVLYLNGDDALLCELGSRGSDLDLTEEVKSRIKSTKIVYYGINQDCSYYAKDIKTTGGQTHFTCVYPGGTEKIVLSVLGLHNVGNALVSLAIAAQYGIEPSISKKGLLNYQPIAMRGQIHEKNGIKVIDDTYNASPDSMKSGISVLLELSGAKRRIAVFADVLELGEVSRQCHYNVGEYIAELALTGRAINEMITVGTEAREIAKAIDEKKVSISTHSFERKEEAINYLKGCLREGDAVLVKGSRGMHMEEIVDCIMQ